MTYTVRPLTPALWPQLEALFGPAGACNGCWCMYWRIGSAYTKRPREQNKVAFQRVVKKGPPPGILAFDLERVVGWCQITPRRDHHGRARGRFTAAGDQNPVWRCGVYL